MATTSRNKVIQVQKPAQSLTAFQQKVASGDDIKEGYLKPLLIAAGSVLVVMVGVFSIRAIRASGIEKFETSLAELQTEVSGDGMAPVPPAELERRMRERLPRLEALAQAAPGSRREVAEGLVATWRLELDGKGAVTATPKDSWGTLRRADRELALGKGTEALATLTPLRGDATPDQAWASLYWSTLLNADLLQGDRAKAWQDYADYKARFKDQADPALEHLLAGV